MTDGQKRLKRLPLAACAAVAVCVLGFIYSIYFSELFEQLHWYSFSADAGLSREDFNSIMSFITVALVIYYTLFLVVASLMFLKSKKYIPLSLLLMALLKLCTLLLMFRPGRNMVFQLGFESVVEIITLLSIAFLYKNIRKNARLYDSRITICIIGIVAEITPFLRNCQFLFYRQINVPVKLCVTLLPCATAAFFVLTTLKAAGRRPVRKLKAVKASGRSTVGTEQRNSKTVKDVSSPIRQEPTSEITPVEAKASSNDEAKNTDEKITEPENEATASGSVSGPSPSADTVRPDNNNIPVNQHSEGKKTAVVKKFSKNDVNNSETKKITVSGKNSETRTITVTRKKTDSSAPDDDSPDNNDNT